MSKKPKIPVHSRQDALQHQPFAALDAIGGPTPPDEPAPVPKTPASAKRERLVLRREKSGRGGKTVVVVSGFDPGTPDAALQDLCRKARKACGCGGTVREREIELQGDHPARVRAFFEDEGMTVRGV